MKIFNKYPDTDVKFWLKQLQWERLIHCLVMLATGLAALITTLTVIINPQPLIGLLAIILTILFFAYVLYYFKLETTAHRWYQKIQSSNPSTND